ncbi:GNAT family N-acetyltransferase [Ruminococcus sp.]|uniref:GNAT family N-acetyltransferase n=1 Tax=Ruminococcus sp. TaxID=41978 RepID=UPI0025DB8E3D|nr:GNAT family N-acetyltransferase [Ruminococcus sp.]
MEYSMKIAKGIENNRDAKLIRQAVFIDEQGFVNEFDDIDERAVHAVLYLGGFPVATGRLFDIDGEAHLGRIAVLKAYRGKELGRAIMEALEEYAAKAGYKSTNLSAQLRAQKFYEKLGYEAYGDIYHDEYCPHIAMKKALAADK